MRRTSLILLLALCLPLCGRTQDFPEGQIREIAQKLSSGQRVSLHYSCTVDGYAAAVELSGTLLLQGNCYRTEGNGTEIYCDGSTRWTVDRAGKEVYVEKSGGISEVMQYRDSISRLVISEVKYLPPSDNPDGFSFDVSALDSSWVITDLREE